MRYTTGIVYDDLEPSTSHVAEAELTPEAVTIRYPGWIIKAISSDGFRYRGNYGSPDRVDPQRTLEFRRYTAVNGAVLLFGSWKFGQNGGDWAIELDPPPAAP